MTRSADALLLLHPFPLDATAYRPQVAALAARTRVIAPHAPGFGAPEGNDGEVMRSIGHAADLAVRAVERVGGERVVVVGLSMGGYLAFELWRRRAALPFVIEGLVLACTRSGADDEATAARRLALAARLDSEGSQFLVDNPPAMLSPNAPAALREEVRGIIAAQPARAIAAAARAMAARVDSTPDLATIDVPTLIITAEADALIPPAVTAQLAPQIRGARLASVGAVGHLASLEAADAFTALLAAEL